MVERRILFGIEKNTAITHTKGHINGTTKRRYIHCYIEGGKTT